MNKEASKAFIPITIIFIVTNAFFILGRKLLEQWKVDADVLIIGNLLLIILTAFSYWQHVRALRNKNIQGFLNALKGSMLIKMMICGAAALIYISVAKKAVNTGAILGFMALYFTYTLSEAAIAMKLSKQNKNA